MARRLALLLCLLVVGLPGSQASAQAPAGTILYILDGNVWTIAPNGAGASQVTSGGTWSSPSIADDGTIVAVRDRETIVLLRSDGGVISEIVPPIVGTGVSAAVVSPDAQRVVYEVVGCDSAAGVCGYTAILDLAGNVIGDTYGFTVPALLPNGDVVVEGDHTFGPGNDADQAAAERWFTSDVQVHGAGVSRDGEFMALSGRFFDGRDFEGIGFWQLNGLPPAEPTPLDCLLGLDPPTQSQYLGNVSWAPSGDGLVFQESDASNNDPAFDRILVATDLNPVACSGDIAVLAEGASEPFWGGGTPGSGPPPPPGGGGLPEGVTRIDGGGSADPVAQAVTLSQQLFGDGSAERVVLATADRFPDALAGTALAGPLGPILFTSGLGALDPRVETEIARVTGGNAAVLVLGGTAAISDAAAAQARAAGGDVACTAPLPPSCRFAGAGREETAALIGDVVAAETANPGIVLVARSDDFADAITGGAFAATTALPVLLTPTGLAHPATIAWLEAHPTDLLIALGGTAAISDATLQELPAAERVRVAGADRTATSAAIAAELWAANDLGNGPVAIVNVRDANGWQTALSAAVASALLDMPQLGVENPPATLSDAVRAHLGQIGPRDVVGFGNAALVSDAQLIEAAEALG